jgi:hypothetical protein
MNEPRETLEQVKEKIMPKKSATPDDVIALLNEAFMLDPAAIRALVDHRVPCNKELANHPTIQCGTAESWRKRRPKDHGVAENTVYVVGLLGLLNGILGGTKGGPIAANYDLVCDTCGVRNVPELDGAEIGNTCPICCCSGKIQLGPVVGFTNLWSER